MGIELFAEDLQLEYSRYDLSVILSLYENPSVLGYQSLFPDSAPRSIPNVGWIFAVYPLPHSHQNHAVGISERAYGTDPDLPSDEFELLLPEVHYRHCLRMIVAQLAPPAVVQARDTHLARIANAAPRIAQLSADLPIGFYLIGTDSMMGRMSEDFIVAPDVSFEDVGLLMLDKFKAEQIAFMQD